DALGAALRLWLDRAVGAGYKSNWSHGSSGTYWTHATRRSAHVPANPARSHSPPLASSRWQPTRPAGHADRRPVPASAVAPGREADADSAVPLLPRRHGADVLRGPRQLDLGQWSAAAVGPAARDLPLPADRRHHRCHRGVYLLAQLVAVAAPGAQRGAIET